MLFPEEGLLCAEDELPDEGRPDADEGRLWAEEEPSDAGLLCALAELPDETLLCSLDVLPDEGRAEALDEGLLASPEEACLDADVLSACPA